MPRTTEQPAPIEEGYVYESRGLHGAVHLQFRPLSFAEWFRFHFEVDGLDLAEFSAAVSELMAERIVSWDVEDHEGNPVPVTLDMILRLKPAIWSRLSEVVFANRPRQLRQ